MKLGAQIVNIGVAGCQLLQAEPVATDYFVSKTALLALTRSLALALADRKVRVNMISPGQLVSSIGELDGKPGHVPMGRDGEFDDIIRALDYLEGSDYVTGANIEVAGGYKL